MNVTEEGLKYPSGKQVLLTDLLAGLMTGAVMWATTYNVLMTVVLAVGVFLAVNAVGAMWEIGAESGYFHETRTELSHIYRTLAQIYRDNALGRIYRDAEVKVVETSGLYLRPRDLYSVTKHPELYEKHPEASSYYARMRAEYAREHAKSVLDIHRAEALEVIARGEDLDEFLQRKHGDPHD